MSGMQAKTAGLSARHRRALFRSWHRGMREMDLILGGFADAAIGSLTEGELDDYERLLQAPDREVFGWITGGTEIPTAYDTPILQKIRSFHNHPGPIHS